MHSILEFCKDNFQIWKRKIHWVLKEREYETNSALTTVVPLEWMTMVMLAYGNQQLSPDIELDDSSCKNPSRPTCSHRIPLKSIHFSQSHFLDRLLCPENFSIWDPHPKKSENNVFIKKRIHRVWSADCRFYSDSDVTGHNKFLIQTSNSRFCDKLLIKSSEKKRQ